MQVSGPIAAYAKVNKREGYQWLRFMPMLSRTRLFHDNILIITLVLTTLGLITFVFKNRETHYAATAAFQ